MKIRARKRKSESSGPKVPAYIVTFSDMVTLLLTFFVLLMAFAQEQEELLFKAGRDSFRQAILNFGLVGMSYGKMPRPDMGYLKIKYPFLQQETEPQQSDKRIIDDRGQTARRLFNKLSRSMKTYPSNIVGTAAAFTFVDVHFADSSAELDESAKQTLAGLAADLARSQSADMATIYVVGLADSEATGRQSWALSARRAQAAAEFLRSRAPAESQWEIYCWGAGPGGHWTGSTDTSHHLSHILLGTVKARAPGL